MSKPANGPLRLFFDTDALLAGCASTQGAAHLLLRLAELGLVEAVTCAYVRDEALRNMERKLPKARELLEALLEDVVTVLRDENQGPGARHEGVHPKDLPVWLGFQRSGARYLVTFNVRDYPRGPHVSPPGPIVAEIRAALVRLAAAPDDVIP